MTETLKLTFVRVNETNYRARVTVKEWQDWCQVWDERPDRPQIQFPYAADLLETSTYREANHIHMNLVLQEAKEYAAQFDLFWGP